MQRYTASLPGKTKAKRNINNINLFSFYGGSEMKIRSNTNKKGMFTEGLIPTRPQEWPCLLETRLPGCTWKTRIPRQPRECGTSASLLKVKYSSALYQGLLRTSYRSILSGAFQGVAERVSKSIVIKEQKGCQAMMETSHFNQAIKLEGVNWTSHGLFKALQHQHWF